MGVLPWGFDSRLFDGQDRLYCASNLFIVWSCSSCFSAVSLSVLRWKLLFCNAAFSGALLSPSPTREAHDFIGMGTAVGSNASLHLSLCSVPLSLSSVPRPFPKMQQPPPPPLALDIYSRVLC